MPDVDGELAARLGKAAYRAYCQSVGGKSVHGEPLPEWADLRTGVATAWIRAAIAVVREVATL